MNMLTQDVAGVGGVQLVNPETAGQGVIHHGAPVTIARTDTVAKNLAKIPPHAKLLGFLVSSPANSDAGTSATISIGRTGANTRYVNAWDVKTKGAGQFLPAGGANLFQDIGVAPEQLTGIYAETGTASTAGGPWTVVPLYTLN